MANEISSMIVTGLSLPAKNSQQFTKLDTAQKPGTEGESLPVSGKELPNRTEEQPDVDSAEIREAVSEINDFVQSVQRDLAFNLDEASGRTVIRVIDSDSGELIRQIPSEEVLAMASHLREVRESAMNQNEVPPGLLFSDST